MLADALDTRQAEHFTPEKCPSNSFNPLLGDPVIQGLHKSEHVNVGLKQAAGPRRQ